MLNEDRSALLRDAAQAATEAAYGSSEANEQRVSQILGGLVRTKLLTADDSYRLRDQLMDADAFERKLNTRIEQALLQKGLVTTATLEALQARLQQLETKVGRA